MPQQQFVARRLLRSARMYLDIKTNDFGHGLTML
jgi:hypothetical protein